MIYKPAHVKTIYIIASILSDCQGYWFCVECGQQVFQNNCDNLNAYTFMLFI